MDARQNKTVHDFATALHLLADGTFGLMDDDCYRRAINKAADVIETLLDGGDLESVMKIEVINMSDSKEKEKHSPQTPYKDKEKATTTTTRARARVVNKPTFEELYDFAKKNAIPEEFAKRWFKEMDEVLKWRHPKSGKPIYIWRRYLKLWWENREKFDPLPPVETTPKFTIDPHWMDEI